MTILGRSDRMNLERNLVKFKSVTTTTTLKAYENNVVTDSSAGAFTLTLPPPDQCAGRIFSIYHRTHSGNVTISDGSKSEGWDGDYTLNSVGDGYAFYCDGMHWFPFVALV
jgi:hypothetical protein